MSVYNRGTAKDPNYWISYSITEDLRAKYGLTMRLQRESGSPDGKKCGDKRTAAARLAERRREVRDGVWRPGELSTARLLVETYGERWIAARIKAKVKTAKNEGQRLRDYVFPRIGKRPLADVRRNEIKELFADIRVTPSKHTGKVHSHRTVHRIYEAVRAMYNTARIDEIVHATPCTLRIKREELPPKKDTDPRWRSGAIFTREEFERLISDPRISQQHRIAYALALFSGSRLGEAVGRRWHDYDRTFGPLRKLLVPTQYDDDETKTEVPREVPVHPVLAQMLDEWWDHGFFSTYGVKPTPEVFIVPPRKRWSAGFSGAGSVKQQTMWRWLQDDLKRLGLRRRRVHDTRRTLVTLARADGADKGLLHWVTHGPTADIMDTYSSPPWETLCAQISCLRISLRDGSGAIVPAAAARPAGVDGVRVDCRHCGRTLLQLGAALLAAAGPVSLTCVPCGTRDAVDLEGLTPSGLALPEHAGPPGAAGGDGRDWVAVDWTRTDKELATETGANTATVFRRRRELGHPPSAGKRGKKPRSEA